MLMTSRGIWEVNTCHSYSPQTLGDAKVPNFWFYGQNFKDWKAVEQYFNVAPFVIQFVILENL